MIYLDNDIPKIEEELNKNKDNISSFQLNNGYLEITFKNNTKLTLEYVEYEGFDVKLKPCD